MPVSLSFLLALLLRILAGREEFHYDPELGHGALTWFFGLVSAFLLLHLLAGTARTRARDGGRTEPVWLLPLRAILPLLPLILYGLVLFPGGWLLWVEVSIDPHWDLTRECFALLPYLWFEVLSLLGALRLHGTPRPSWLRLRKILAALPIWAGVWLVQDLLPYDPWARAALDELPLARPVSMLLTGLLLLPFAPLWVRWLYSLGPLPHPEYATVLSSMADRLGLRFRRYCMLFEEPLSPGPMFLRGFRRTALLPRHELEEFRGREFEVLFVSALQRIKQRMGLRLMALALLLPLAFLSLYEMGASERIGPKVALVVLIAFFVLLIGMLAWFRRRYVLEADLLASGELGPAVCEESFLALIERGEDPGPRVFEPGLQERLDFLVQADDSSAVRRYFRRATRYGELVLLVVVMLSFGVTARDWQTRWDQSLPSFELSLGEVSKAEHILEAQLASYRAERRAYEAAQAGQDGIVLEGAGAWDEDGYAWAEHLRDLISRARLLIHDEGDEGRLDLLRPRALARARLALLRGQRASRSGESVTGLDGKAERNASFEQAFAWYELARRWGRDRSTIEALQLGLVSRLFEDHRGLRRSRYLLRRLEIPAELDDPIRIVLGS